MSPTSSKSPSPRAFHPLAETFPLMKGDEFVALVADIKAHGLREPIWMYEDKILDGRNRERACLEAGKDPEYRTFSGNHAEALAFVVSANIHRRHLTTKEKQELIAKLLEAAPEKSDRQIAKAAKVGHKTVGRARKKGEARGAIPPAPKRTDSKGRKQPASKKGRPKGKTGKARGSLPHVPEQTDSKQPASKTLPTLSPAGQAIHEAQIQNVLKNANFAEPEASPDEDKKLVTASLQAAANQIEKVLEQTTLDDLQLALELVGKIKATLEEAIKKRAN